LIILGTQKISIRNAKFAKIGLCDMCEYIGDMSKMIMVEIGCYVGDSTEIFAQNVGHMFCIDPWENGYDENDGASSLHPMDIVESQFKEMAKGFNNITRLKGKGEDFVNSFADKSLDMVYIDGLHTYDGVKNDIKMWATKIKDGGFLCGHDYGSKHFPGVKEAVDEFGIPNKTFRDSSWIIKI